jgi:hypothetical protein
VSHASLVRHRLECFRLRPRIRRCLSASGSRVELSLGMNSEPIPSPFSHFAPKRFGVPGELDIAVDRFHHATDPAGGPIATRRQGNSLSKNGLTVRDATWSDGLVAAQTGGSDSAASHSPVRQQLGRDEQVARDTSRGALSAQPRPQSHPPAQSCSGSITRRTARTRVASTTLAISTAQTLSWVRLGTATMFR